MVRREAAVAHLLEYLIDRVRYRVVNAFARRFDPAAAAFYERLVRDGYEADAHINVLPRHRLIYVSVPKCASTTIKMTLSGLVGRKPGSTDETHKRRHSGLQAPRHVGLSEFYRLASDPATLRFTFVRNPYDRLVSAWADKFRDKPLVAGDPFINRYLAARRTFDASLPAGPGRTMSFAEFVGLAAVTADCRFDPHWHLQSEILDMPGLALDFIGKVEAFDADFARVLDHAGVARALRQPEPAAYNATRHQAWQSYYTPALADQVYRAYERDFDRCGYARTIPG